MAFTRVYIQQSVLQDATQVLLTVETLNQLSALLLPPFVMEYLTVLLILMSLCALLVSDDC